MIWKAPWGSYIDLDVIVAIHSANSSSFAIDCQLMDRPIIVDASYQFPEYAVTNTSTSSFDELYQYRKDLINSWHTQVVWEWTKHKNKRNDKCVDQR